MADGLFYADGIAKYYAMSDNLKSHNYEGLTPTDAIEIVRNSGLNWNKEKKMGIWLHILDALPEYGKCGYTAVANTLEEAIEMSKKLQMAFDEAVSEKNL